MLSKKKNIKPFRLIFLMICLSIAILPATAQEEENRPDTRHNVLKTEVFPTFFGSYGLHYERMFGESASISNGLEITYIEREYRLRGLSYHFEVRGYLNYWRHIPEGFYLSTFVNARGYDFQYFADLAEEEEILERTFNGGLGLGTGNQWLLFNNRLAVDLSLRFGYYIRHQTITRIKDEIDIQDDGSSNVILRMESSRLVPDSFRLQVGLGLGWAF